MFGSGASPYLVQPYGIKNTEGCELVRVALQSNHCAPVSRIVAIAFRLLRRTYPALRLVVSFADPEQGHHGGIYQAGGWIYTGTMDEARYFKINGKTVHPRTIGAKGIIQSIDAVRAALDPFATVIVKAGKHRYLMPLDDAMRERCAPLAQPYPRRTA